MRTTCVVLLAVSLFAISPLAVYAFSAQDIIQYSTRHDWYVGKGLTPGDSFEYLVCDHTMYRVGLPEGCYHIRMDFYAELKSYARDVWVVQAEIITGNHTYNHIFLVGSDSLDVRTDHGAAGVADSIQDTVFDLAEFAHRQAPSSLRVGQVWGSVLSPVELGSELVVVSEDTIPVECGADIDVFVIRYGLFESSVFTVSPYMPFPISAITYDPSYIASDPPVMYSHTLLDYTRGADPTAGIESDIFPRCTQ